MATEGESAVTTDVNAEITIYEKNDEEIISRYDSDSTTATETAAAPSVHTEIWLQVDADGQIDVTVPLVLVFKTNIDGGKATSPSEYKITNHSSADLVVTKIERVIEEERLMTLVSKDTATLGENQYKVKLSSTKQHPSYTGTEDVTYDLHANNISDDNRGLIYLPSDAGDDYATGRDTNLKVEMETGKLNFVTSRIVEDNKDMGMDTTKGVKLLTVTYTVAIDTYNAKGVKITDASELFKAPATNP
ncbi:MAG: hypothetical protein IKT57_04785 [Clostridia bacterium]|nr:hypothetical protein [Clostridia bacterium]